MINETLWLSMAAFAFVTAFTPGPNNLMLMSSTILFGGKRTIPHLIGIQIGFSTLMAAAVLGLGELLELFPDAQMVVKWLGAGWLLWLGVTFLREAVRQHRSKGETQAPKASRPFTVIEAALFQLANPKALVMVLSTASLYSGIAEDITLRTVIIVLTFSAVGTPSGISWMLLGRAMNRWLGDASHGRVMNIAMGVLILALVAVILMN
ncbi:LysE family translocator [Paremcibacter congregatus]|uniref:LysE family translocator n=1 Tax=Paremcibacter congregatus TaxID=2043170 RepID=UPI003A95BFD5|tara:strand:+ start:1343 stop:1966 length:624 start_codon:yes stop_codon:yes gene_type:complete